jgi:hypothetical protein
VSRAISAAAVVIVAAGAMIAGAAFAGTPDEVGADHPERLEPVLRSTSVCSYVGGEPRADSRIGVFALPGIEEPAPLPGAEDDPDIEVLALGDDEPIGTVDERGIRRLTTVEADSPASYAVRAEGPLAPGVVSEQWMWAEGPDLRGLVTASCRPSGREHWFVGASAAEGQRGRLVLSNPSPTPASVRISLWDEEGPVDSSGTTDYSIEAGGEEVVVLDALAPGSEQLAVRVQATRGRIAAALDHRETAAGEPRGISMIPAATAPAETVVIPGIPGSGGRSLRIAAPGETDAIVSVQILGPDGTFSPVDLDVLTVPAGTVLEVAAGDAIGEDPSAIRLVSDEPITAGMRVSRSLTDALPEVAFTAATEPLPTGPLATVIGRDNSDLSTSLLFTAVGEAGGRVSVRTVDSDGETVAEDTLEIPAGTTRELELERPEDYTWVTTVIDVSAGGTVVGARYIVGSDEGGRLLDLMPLVAPQITVAVPEVAGELTP